MNCAVAVAIKTSGLVFSCRPLIICGSMGQGRSGKWLFLDVFKIILQSMQHARMWPHFFRYLEAVLSYWQLVIMLRSGVLAVPQGVLSSLSGCAVAVGVYP